MASAEILPMPALVETLLSDTGAHLKLYAPEIDAPLEDIGKKIRILIPDVGSVKNGAQFAMDVSRQNGSLIVEDLISRNGRDWNVMRTETIELSDHAAADDVIEERRRLLFAGINWDASGNGLLS